MDMFICCKSLVAIHAYFFHNTHFRKCPNALCVWSCIFLKALKSKDLFSFNVYISHLASSVWKISIFEGKIISFGYEWRMHLAK